MKNKIKTYGKANPIKRLWAEITNARRINPHAQRIAENKGLSVYLPKLNKIKVSIGILGIIVLIITPFTPDFLIIPFIIKWVLS